MCSGLLPPEFPAELAAAVLADFPSTASNDCKGIWGSHCRLRPVGNREGDHGGAETRLPELIRQAAQGEVVHNDDTTMKILAVMPARGPTEECARGEVGAHRGIHFRDRVDARRAEISLFFSGPHTCRGKLGRCAVAAGLGVRSTDPNVRRPFAQSAQGISGDPALSVAHGRRRVSR